MPKAEENQNNFWLKLANFLGSLGYVAVLVQWVWVLAAIGLPYFQNSSWSEVFLAPEESEVVEVQPTESGRSLDLSSPAARIFYIVTALFIFGLVGYGIWYSARGLGQAGSKVVHNTAHAAAESIARPKHAKKPVPEKQIHRWTINISWSLKILLFMLPLFLLFIPAHQSSEFDHDLSLIVGTFLAACSFIWFLLQFAVAKFAHLNQDSIW